MIKTNYIELLCTDLISRLPELEWQLSRLTPSVFNQALPKNLFQTQELTADSCMEELKADVLHLKAQKHEQRAAYLAEHLKRKISILVGLCRLQQKNKDESKSKGFSLKKLSTRQQWLQTLEEEASTLKKQRDALSRRLELLAGQHHNASMILNLKAELGDLEKKLTLAQETLNNACQK